MTPTAIALAFDRHDRRILWGAIAFFGTALATYFVFLGMSVVDAVGRTQAMRQTDDVRVRLADLEVRYAAAGRALADADLSTEGYVAVANPVYIVGAPTAVSSGLSFRGR